MYNGFMPQGQADINEVIIEQAKPEHAADIFKIQKKTWLATYPNKEIGITASMIENYFANSDSRIDRWTQNIANKNSRIWIARINNEVIGFCGVLNGVRKNRLSSIYVNPDHHGSGVGGKLIKEALEYLGSKKDIVIDVASYNEQAIGSYKRYGFEIMQTIPEEDLLQLEDVMMPEIRMVLRAKTK